MSTTGHDARWTADRVWWTAGWILVPPSVIVLLTLALAASVPGGYFELAIWGMLGGLVLGGCWLVTGIVTLVRDVRAGRLRQRARGYWRHALVPGLAVLTLLIGGLGLPRQARFALDRPELEASADQVRAGRIETGVRLDRRIGTLPVSRVEERQGCVLFTVDGAGFLDTNGYAHCIGAAPEVTEHGFTHLTGPWHTWYRRF